MRMRWTTCFTATAFAAILLLALAPIAVAVIAAGGTTTEVVNGYRIHTFRTSGTLTVTATGSVNVLVVAGGGGGGGGGGGAGGFLSATTNLTNGSFTVTVGGSGTAGSATIAGGAGGNSVFGSLTAFGGGGGNQADVAAGKNGGSGGGGGAASILTSLGGNGTAGQGFNGGGNGGFRSSPYAAGGGGGAGSAGSNALNNGTSGGGGQGKLSSISGSDVVYAGGGGGACYLAGTNGLGGSGGGGAGGAGGTAGAANTGSGGGGTRNGFSGGSGGSGIVIVRYPAGGPVVSNISAVATESYVTLNGFLVSSGNDANVSASVFWGTNDAGTNMAGWAFTNPIPGVAVVGPLSVEVTPLTADVMHYYRFFASNALWYGWAQPSGKFSSTGAPSVFNWGTIGPVGPSSATVQGELLAGNPDPFVSIYWGLENQGTNTALWEHTNDVGVVSNWTFAASIGRLAPGQSYFYTIGASNSYGEAWSTVLNLTTDRARTWGGASGLWSDETKWVPTGVPGDGEIITLPVGNYTNVIRESSSNLLSYTQYGGTLGFSNWTTALRADTVTIVSGKVDCARCDTNIAPDNINRVWIIATNLTISSTNGSINVDGKGFRGGVAIGIITNNGQGPGGGLFGTSYGTAGASHGGRGGTPYSGDGAPGPVYGVVEAPAQPGSGGAGYNGGEGGAGGGAIRLEVSDRLTVNGTISASGGGGYGAGSGGAIHISCMTVAASGGVVRANGGRGGGTVGSGGGGGRVAILYDSTRQASVETPVALAVSAAHGSQDGYYSWNPIRDGSPGTVYFRDNRLIQTSIGNDAGGQFFWDLDPTVLNVTQLSIVDTRLPFLTPQLVLRDFAHNFSTWVEFPEVRAFTVSNDLLLNNAKLVISNCVLQVGGDLTATNSGRLYVYAAATNAGPAAYGALVAATNDMLIASNSWIFPVSHATNGGAVLFRMTDLRIATTNAGFNADGLGFSSKSPANWFVPPWGYGPGSGGYESGGGYGGKGGMTYGGGVYGNSYAPIQCGSSGGAYSPYVGYPGGGLVRIEASGKVDLQGRISAKGLALGTVGQYTGGGSGGGIFIRCLTFTGSTNAELIADGGYGGNAGAGGGGGGRIAVWYRTVTDSNAEKIINGQVGQVVGSMNISTSTPTYLGRVSTAGGLGVTGKAGLPGTVVFLSVGRPPGTVIVVQ